LQEMLETEAKFYEEHPDCNPFEELGAGASP
jgi:hypothetical protein